VGVGGRVAAGRLVAVGASVGVEVAVCVAVAVGRSVAVRTSVGVEVGGGVAVAVGRLVVAAGAGVEVGSAMLT
jgi:hypothetical protein